MHGLPTWERNRLIDHRVVRDLNHGVCFFVLILHPANPSLSDRFTGNVAAMGVLTWINVFVPLVRFLPLGRPLCVSLVWEGLVC